jgi:tRNA threonylcarbamoyladenosine biosynthesis protein TsaE
MKYIDNPDGTRSVRTDSELETRAVATLLAGQLGVGDVIALVGGLGAGKTAFTKALAAALDVPADDVNSPTFTLIQEYLGRILLRHCDTYRLRNPDEFADLGLDELFATDGVAIVEWADRVTEFLPRDRLEIHFTVETPTSRTLSFKAYGKRSQRLLDQFDKFKPKADPST